MPSRSSRLPLVVATIAGIVVIAAVTVAAFFVVPSIVRAWSTQVATTDLTIELASDGATAVVPVDEDWSYIADDAGGTQATLISPDGVFRIDFTLAHGVDPENAAAELAGGEVTPFDHEPIGEASVVHARSIDDDAIVGAVVAGEASVAFIARPAAGYEAEVAQLLSRIEVGQ